MSLTDDLEEARQRLATASARLRRHLDGRRPTLPPEAQPFHSCTRMLSSAPEPRDYPTCKHCGEPIKRGGETDELGNWMHDFCFALATGKRAG